MNTVRAQLQRVMDLGIVLSGDDAVDVGRLVDAYRMQSTALRVERELHDKCRADLTAANATSQSGGSR